MDFIKGNYISKLIHPFQSANVIMGDIVIIGKYALKSDIGTLK